MLSETMLGAVADAVFGYVLGQTGIAEKIRSQLGRDPARLAFREALKGAYRSFHPQYPELADSLFDEHFLQHGAAAILARSLLSTDLPDPSELVQAWAEQLGQPVREANVNRLTRAAADFLRFMEEELHNREEFYALFNTRNLGAIRKATMHTDQTLNAIDEKLTKMLADPIKVYETTVS